MSDDDDLDTRIARYRTELQSEADLARGDLDELEDHLRCLTAELRERGLPATAALAEAARRLGDPAALAREHAKVGAPFGARISRTRAWSAAALLAPFGVYFLYTNASAGRLLSSAGAETMLACALVVAVALRLSWARMFVLGTLPFTLATMIPWLLAWGGTRFMLIQIVAYAGAIVFLAPWRRREMSRAGLGLMLMGPAYGGAATLTMFEMSRMSGDLFGSPLALLAIGAVLAGSLGGMLRARWGAIACLGASCALAAGLVPAWTLDVNYSHPAVFRALIVVPLAVGMATSLAAAVLGWRAARSTTGTLRGLIA